MNYLIFKSPWSKTIRKHNFIERLIFALKLSSNPDYDKDKIDNVMYWIVEFDEDNIPNREIGLNHKNEVILKMPYKRNYGYWTDNNLIYNDFIHKFEAEPIQKSIFFKYWEDFK